MKFRNSRLYGLAVYAVGVPILCAGAFLVSARPALATKTITACTFSTTPGWSFGTSVDVYSLPSAVISAAFTGTCTDNGGNGSCTNCNGTFTIGGGSNYQSGSQTRAMKCTTGCGSFAGDLLLYYLCGNLDTSCNTNIIQNGTDSFTIPNGGSHNWSETVHAKILAAIPGGTNDSAVGSYTDSVLITLNP